MWHFSYEYLQGFLSYESFFLKMYWFFCPSVRFSAYKVAIKFSITMKLQLKIIIYLPVQRNPVFCISFAYQMQTITAVLDIRTPNYYTLIHTGIKYDVLINTTKRRLTIILVYYTNVLCREEKGCNIIKLMVTCFET